MAAQIAYIRLDIHIRFRAFGVTFGDWNDHIVFPLPPLVQLIEQFVNAHPIGNYDNHGVSIKASLVSTPIG